MVYGYIYYTKNEINGKKYIGKITSHTLCSKRNYKGSGTVLAQALKEYGPENFTVHFIATADSSEELTFLEKYYLIYYKIPNDDFYNVNLATSSSEQSNYYNKNNDNGVNLKNIICYNIKNNSQVVFNNITQFCRENGFSRGCLFNVMTGQRVTHKDCVFWYEDFPISKDALNWILNYKNKTAYKTKYFTIAEVKAEMKKNYDLANNKNQNFEFHGYYIEDGKEVNVDWDEMIENYQNLALRDGKAPIEATRIDDLQVEEVKDDKFEKERDTECILFNNEIKLYFNYDEINSLTKIYPDINPRLLRQAVNRGQKTVMSKKYSLIIRKARSK